MMNMTRKKGNNLTRLIIVSLLGLAIIFVMSAFPAKAAQDSSGFPSITIESYTIGGATTYYSGGSIPVGAVIDFRVWVDLYNVDPVKIGYGDGSSDSYSFNGAFSHDFYHAYQTANSYIAIADMPTDSGTFDGGAPVVIGSSSGTGGGGNGGSGGNSGFPDISALPPTSLVAAAIGFIAILMAALPVSVVGLPASPNAPDSEGVYVDNATTPQLLRSPQTERDEQARLHNKECVNLKAVYDDACKQAKFAGEMEEHSRQLFAETLRKLPKEYLQEYLKDKIKDAAVEIPIDIMMAFIGAEELEVLAEICKKAATTLIAEEDPTILTQLMRTYQTYSDIRKEAERLKELADFRLNSFKSSCPDWFN